MTILEATAHKIPFGQYQGKTISEIGRTDKGLRDLDWLRGQHFVNDKWPDTAEAISVYLSHPQISRLVDRAIGD
jgi:hypothetical protein